jgi:Asp-tRNA(Asn)/Glu-tRNA(Gln) amidotransferase A subunit family amidase
VRSGYSVTLLSFTLLPFIGAKRCPLTNVFEKLYGVRYGYRAEGGSNLIEMYRKTRSEGFGSEVKLPINIAGVCGISIPCGFTSTGLPIGLQIIGKAFDEEMVLKVAYVYEQNTEHHLRKPKL